MEKSAKMIEKLAQEARSAAIRMATLSAGQKNQALGEIAQALKGQQEEIVQANYADLEQAQRENLKGSLLKRLKFGSAKLKEAIAGVASLINLPDPVGQTLRAMELDSGLELYKVSCPIGVLGIVFESRPDALVQISTLALKSGNAVLLKGGSEAARTNSTLAEIIRQAAEKAGMPAGWMSLLESREDVKAMLGLDKYIDLIIPRGSNAFVKYIMDNTRIAVLGHADGICHVYIDEKADIEMAVRVAYDAKCQYAAVCNAMETLLVHRVVAGEVLGQLKKLYDEAGVELRGDEQVQRLIDCKEAKEEDWRTEYNDLILSLRIVDSLDEAIEHINIYGSHHTDAIITEDRQAAGRFMNLVDSANVFWNCSTRYSDGYRYGLGAEVGISTGKLHARGPVGLEGLVIYKWKLIGKGQVVADYSGPDARKYTHKPLEKDCPL